jgi:ADP-heptose:LPS heptosyltransferase
MKRLIVMHLGGLGDLICSLPTIRLLAEHYREAETVFVGDRDRCEVVEMSGLPVTVADALQFPWRALWDQATPATPADFGDVLGVAEFWQHGEHTQRLQELTGGWYKSICDQPPWPDGATQAQRIFGYARAAFNLEGAYADPLLVPDACHFARVTSEVGQGGGDPPYIVIAPGAGNGRKVWDEQSFWLVGQTLRERLQCTLVCLLGPAEAGRGLDAPRGLFDYVARSWPIQDVAALLSLASIYIGNDSGPAHLAAWCKHPWGTHVPCVILYRASAIAAWRIDRPWVRNLSFPDGRPQELSVEEVTATALELVRAAASSSEGQ